MNRTSVDLTCIEPGCDLLAGSKASGHRCTRHYADHLAWRIAVKNGEVIPEPVRDVKPCTVSGCTRALQAKGLCPAHYQRMRKGLDLNAPMRQYNKAF